MLSEPSADVRELVQGAQLDKVFCRLASVELLDEEREGGESPLLAGLTIGRRKGSPDDQTRDFRITLDLAAHLPSADLRTVFVAQYSAPVDLGDLLTDEIITEYANHVAVMTLLPYIRESLADLGRRVGVNFTLPILQRGQMVFETPTHEATRRP